MATASANSAASTKLRTGDTVMVIAGNDRGRTGTIKEIQRAAGRIVVEGINLRWKHKKPSQKNPKGERLQMEISIHSSNVMHIGSDGKLTREAPARVEKNHSTAKNQPKATKGQQKGKGR